MTPYDTVNSVLNAARVRLNGDLSSLAPTTGTILRTPDAFSLQMVNNAWRHMQEFLANRGYMRLIRRAILLNIPPSGAATDPTSQSYLNWNGYFDGANFQASPSLPQDLTFPLWVHERISGQNALFVPCNLWLDGFPSDIKQSLNRLWEWREDSLYFPGATGTTDFEIRYASFLADFADSGTTRWFNQVVPIVRCQDAFSLYICAEFVGARDNPDLTMAATYLAQAEDKATLIANRDARFKQRVTVRRKSRSGRLEGECSNALGTGWW